MTDGDGWSGRGRRSSERGSLFTVPNTREAFVESNNKKSAEAGGRKGAEGALGSSRVATPPPGSERTMSHRSAASRLSGPGPPAAGEPPHCAHSRGAGRETESFLALCLQPAAKTDALLGPCTGLEG